jgi:hypothetical protein
MTHRFACTAILSFGLATTACGSSMNTPKIEKNPHPVQRYELTLTLHDVPRTFDMVGGTVQYRIGNSGSCAPQDPISGLHRTLDQLQPITFTRVDADTYKASMPITSAWASAIGRSRRWCR